MSIDARIADAGTIVSVEADEIATGPAQTSMGGVDRSDSNWVTIADGVPCLIEIEKPDRIMINDQVRYETKAIIYLMSDPVPGGMSISHRIRVMEAGHAGSSIRGLWAVIGVTDPVPFGHHLEVNALRIGLPS